MYTAKHARLLWCPMVRASNGEDSPCNAGNGEEYRSPKYARCIAQECAMWRWLPEPPAATVSIGIGLVTEELPRIPTERRGYCGLAPIYHTTT